MRLDDATAAAPPTNRGTQARAVERAEPLGASRSPSGRARWPLHWSGGRSRRCHRPEDPVRRISRPTRHRRRARQRPAPPVRGARLRASQRRWRRGMAAMRCAAIPPTPFARSADTRCSWAGSSEPACQRSPISRISGMATWVTNWRGTSSAADRDSAASIAGRSNRSTASNNAARSTPAGGGAGSGAASFAHAEQLRQLAIGQVRDGADRVASPHQHVEISQPRDLREVVGPSARTAGGHHRPIAALPGPQGVDADAGQPRDGANRQGGSGWLQTAVHYMSWTNDLTRARRTHDRVSRSRRTLSPMPAVIWASARCRRRE